MRPVHASCSAALLVLAACSHRQAPATGANIANWSLPIGSPIDLGSVGGQTWQMWVSARRDGWVDLFISPPPEAARFVDAVRVPLSTGLNVGFSRALVEPELIERFAHHIDAGVASIGRRLSSAEYDRWNDSIVRNHVRVSMPVARLNVGDPTDTGAAAGVFPSRPGGLWMQWTPLTPGSRVGMHFSFRLGTGCLGPGGSSPTGFFRTLDTAQNDALRATLLRAAADARRFRSRPAPLSGDAVRSRGEVTCGANPIYGNPLPHYPAREAVRHLVVVDARVELVIDTSGRVVTTKPVVGAAGLDSTERARFATEAGSILKEWRFIPARTSNGRATRQRLRALVRFTPPAARDVPLSFFDSTATFPAITAARADTADLLVMASRVPRGEEEITRMVTTSDGVRLHVSDGGPRCSMPIVIVSYPGTSVERWRQVIEPLRDAHRVVAYDLRGHGGSSAAPNRDYSVQAHVRDLSSVFDSLGLDRAVLVSQAEGWKIAMTFAAAATTDRVVGTLALGPTDLHTMPQRDKLSWFDRIGAVARGKSDQVPSWPQNGPLYAGLRDLVVSDLRRADSTALYESNDRIFSYDIAENLLAYRGPKVIVGTPNPAVPRRDDDYFVKLVYGPTGYATLLDPGAVTRIIDEQMGFMSPPTAYRACVPAKGD